MTDVQRHILLCEDDAVTRRLLEQKLTEANFQVHAPDASTANFAQEVLNAARSKSIHIAICDLTLPDGMGSTSVTVGMSFIHDLRRLPGRPFVFVYSGSVDEQALTKLRKIGVAQAFSKDDHEGLVKLIDACKAYGEKSLARPKIAP